MSAGFSAVSLRTETGIIAALKPDLVHELVHLIEPHHTPEFWRRVERVLPDFDGRKRWLASKGAAAISV